MALVWKEDARYGLYAESRKGFYRVGWKYSHHGDSEDWQAWLDPDGSEKRNIFLHDGSLPGCLRACATHNRERKKK